jgi:hypothetical protein
MHGLALSITNLSCCSQTFCDLERLDLGKLSPDISPPLMLTLLLPGAKSSCRNAVIKSDIPAGLIGSGAVG